MRSFRDLANSLIHPRWTRIRHRVRRGLATSRSLKTRCIGFEDPRYQLDTR